MRLPSIAASLLLCLVPAVLACGGSADAGASPAASTATQPPPENLEVATFAGGCFWCMEPPFEKLDGVLSVVSGYTGGPEENPTYEQVSYGRTGHAEAVEITFDPAKISYAELLEVYWRNIDPTAVDRQFADRGKQYRTAIFVHSEEQRRLAEASKRELAETGPFDEPLVTPILDAEPFYRAEEYHQDFYKKNPVRYKSYYVGSGRAGFLEQTWGESD